MFASGLPRSISVMTPKDTMRGTYCRQFSGRACRWTELVRVVVGTGGDGGSRVEGKVEESVFLEEEEEGRRDDGVSGENPAIRFEPLVAMMVVMVVIEIV